MKSFASAMALVLVLLVPVTFAGDYHNGGTLLCSQCHVMHFSQSHGYQPNGTGFYLEPAAGGPFHYLLRDEVNNLCLACHDQGGIAPDVLGAANGGNGPTDVREAGYLNRLGVEGLPATGHTLDSLDTAPGSDPPWKPEDNNGAGEGLNCINCHHQHGYAGFGSPTGSQYRNLLANPGAGGNHFVTYNNDTVGTNNLARDVFERQAAEYDESVVDWNEPDNTQSAIGAWCGGCHTNFHGTPGDPATVGGEASGAGYAEFLRHPTAGVNIGAIGSGHSGLSIFQGHTNKVKVMSEVGVWDPPGADVTPTCVSCHKAHGNGNAFGLIYRSGTGTLTENGDTNGSQLEHLCGQCHTQASFFANP
ncbi:MAG: hypothetical protein H6825_08160 [Planctomycetes bacterium]|nr:hypothetical protein [Planctomycetota bacterium]